jgi:serine/threonine protein kinase
MNIVHRDLATRNVLVGIGGRVKIADFGLAQITDGDGYYYYCTNQRSLPVKWYAPETLSHKKFSHKSDVWSFGVTLHEIFTFGESPNLQNNPNLDANIILELLTSGVRLDCPRFCPQSVYEDIMFVCWNFNPRLRPRFSELLERLNHQLIENGESV